MKLFEEDEELLNDVIVEYRQASEMCSIYTDVITRAMDAFSGVVSNNVNASMGVLTTITLLLSIPTVVFSFYGMNTNLLPMSDSWVFPCAFGRLGGRCRRRAATLEKIAQGRSAWDEGRRSCAHSPVLARKRHRRFPVVRKFAKLRRPSSMS